MRGSVRANPCAADLVARAQHWKGVTSWGLKYGAEVTFQRPDYGIWTPLGKPKKSKSTKGKGTTEKKKADGKPLKA